MEKELQNFNIARFALQAQYEDVEPAITDQLKRHVLDALGSFIQLPSRSSANS